MFQEDGLWGPGLWGPWCARGVCVCLRLCFRYRFAKPGVCLGPRGLGHAMMASSQLHALTQQKHRPGAPSLACQGLPSWPGPSQATVPRQAGAEHLHRVPRRTPSPPTGPGHSGHLAVWVSLSPSTCLGLCSLGQPSRAWLGEPQSSHPKSGALTLDAPYIPDALLWSARDQAPLGRNHPSEARPPL